MPYTEIFLKYCVYKYNPLSIRHRHRPWVMCCSHVISISSLIVGKFRRSQLTIPGELWGSWCSVWSTLCKICRCASRRIVSLKSGACIESPRKGNHLHYLQNDPCRSLCSCFLAKTPVDSQWIQNNCYMLWSCLLNEVFPLFMGWHSSWEMNKRHVTIVETHFFMWLLLPIPITLE